MATAYVERVAMRASDIRLARVLLTIVASPFYLLGMLAGVFWVVLAWMLAAVQVGFGDVRNRDGERDI